jgi:hypothetical protein
MADSNITESRPARLSDPTNALRQRRHRMRSPCCAREMAGIASIAPPSPAMKSRRHSITSSAMASMVGGISRPIALAALRLMTNSNFVGWNTGSSAGFRPFRTSPV